MAIERYQRSISKPILERIDICVESSPIKFSELSSGEGNGEKSEVIRKRVEECREIQKERFKNYKSIKFNSQMTTKEIKKFCDVGAEEKEYLRKIFGKNISQSVKSGENNSGYGKVGNNQS